jgi:hypothetical protein
VRGKGGLLVSGIGRSIKGAYIFFPSRNDAGLRAGFIKFRLPKVCGHPIRMSGENEKYLLAPQAAKAKKFFSHLLLYF